MSNPNEKNYLRSTSYVVRKSNSSIVDYLENERPILTEKDLMERYSFAKLESNDALKSTYNYCVKYYKPSRNCMSNYVLDRFPFFSWIFKYDFRESFVKDLIAGLTIGIVHIPQGMAYSLMAGLPAVYGLYVSFFPVLIYAFLGTSRHLSTGSFAITSLMTFSCIDRLEGKYYGENLQDQSLNLTEVSIKSPSDLNYLSLDPIEAKVKISMAITLVTGLLQILFSILHIGFVTKYLSDVIVTGFTTGAALHIVLSQINPLLGISTGKVTIPFKLFGNLVEIMKNIDNMNVPTAIVGIVSLVLFILVRELINERYKEKMFMPVPIELILVVFGTLFAYIFDFDTKWNIKIVGDLPRGIPAPSLPPIHIVPDIIRDSVSIAIVSFALNISMAKLFSKKYKYELNPNQEALAYGIGNIVSAFFKGFPACVALSRSAILDGVGGKTQMYAIVSSSLILLVCLAFGPLFRTLPNTVLAAIIIVALKNMLLQITQFPDIFRRSKFEALAWSGTFLSVIILDVDIGLYIGVILALLLIIFRSQRPRMSVLGNIPMTDIYECIKICEEATEIPTVKILRYEESIYYANVDNFKYKVIKYSDINVDEVINKMNKEKRKYAKLFRGNNTIKEGFFKMSLENAKEDLEKRLIKIQEDVPVKHVVLDCSSINNIDSQGVLAFIQLYEAFKEIGVTLHLTFCKPCVLKMFKKLKFNEKFDYEYIYPTTHDALLHILHRKAESRNSSSEENKDLNITCENSESKFQEIVINELESQSNLIN